MTRSLGRKMLRFRQSSVWGVSPGSPPGHLFPYFEARKVFLDRLAGIGGKNLLSPSVDFAYGMPKNCWRTRGKSDLASMPRYVPCGIVTDTVAFPERRGIRVWISPVPNNQKNSPNSVTRAHGITALRAKLRAVVKVTMIMLSRVSAETCGLEAT